MREAKARKKKKNVKNIVCIILIIILLALMILTLYIDKRDVSKESLLNPSENIEMGLDYFKYLMNMFNNNEFLSILAYNAGPGNIKKWLNDSTISSDEIDVFIENIPYLETKNYIKKILSSYWIYLNIYSPKNK